MARRPATARASLNGRARRSDDDKPERHFSGLRRAGPGARFVRAGVLEQFPKRIHEAALSPVRADACWQRLASGAHFSEDRLKSYIEAVIPQA